MPHDTPRERRQPRIDVHHLRRDLREADHDRYQLRTELDRQRTEGGRTTPRLLGLMVLIAGGLTTALWMTLPATQRVARTQPAVPTAPSQPTSSALGQDFTLPVEVAVEAPRLARVKSRRVAGVPGGRTRAAAAATNSPALSRAPERDSRPAAAVSNRRDPLRGGQRSDPDEKAPRRRPRPLSPGEFGRAATL